MHTLSLRAPLHKSLLTHHLVESLRSAHHFVIWGRGTNAIYALEECKKFNLLPSHFVDSYSHSDGELYQDIPIISEDTLFSKPTDYIVLVACVPEHKVDEKLKRRQIPFVTFDTTFRTHLSLTSTSFEECINYIVEAKSQLQQVYSMLQDDLSRKTFENALNFRLTLDYSLIDEVVAPGLQYFGNDVLPSISVDTIVDCGAYNGDTLRSFFSVPNCLCKNYFAVEPSEKIFPDLLDSCKQYQDRCNVIPLSAGVWKENTTLNFSNCGNLGDHPVDDEGISVKMSAIDSFAQGYNVGFIKMDIEGSEMNALRGAAQTIQKYHPILAICIYHRSTDFWQVPLFIHSLYGGYKFYVRHHSNRISETVLYAIP